MVQQLSVFAENARGTMADITGALAAVGVNVTALITNDSAEYGIVRMVVSDPELAKSTLVAAGYQCRLAPVMGVYLEDVPGSLARLLAEVRDSGLNVDYLYVSYDRRTAAPIAILHTSDTDEISNHLTASGWRVL